MILAMLLTSQALVSLLILSIPHLTRREILFGVVVPIDFRSSQDGRRAIRMYRSVVAIPAIGGLIAIALWVHEFLPVLVLALLATVVAGMTAFVWQNRKLKAFAIQPLHVRELELSTEPERLPWFTWLGLAPLLLLLAAALYLHANWNSIPLRFPVHWGLDGNPDRWADRSFRGVYALLLFGTELVIWLFGFALAIWYGSRQSEPLRRPTVGLLVAVEWSMALTMSSVALAPVLHVPVALIALGSLPVILIGVIYLTRKARDPRAPLDPTPNECWKGGMIYNNPNDAALFVARRDSVGFTPNMANPWSWVMLGSLPVLIAIGFLVLR
ncbi:MAG: DUF1648 domain-containing protein [Bryobacteraceae bacterium]